VTLLWHDSPIVLRTEDGKHLFELESYQVDQKEESKDNGKKENGEKIPPSSPRLILTLREVLPLASTQPSPELNGQHTGTFKEESSPKSLPPASAAPSVATSSEIASALNPPSSPSTSVPSTFDGNTPWSIYKDGEKVVRAGCGGHVPNTKDQS
jgi:hypothetical protein